MSHPRPRLLIMTILALLALAVACGGDDEATDSGADAGADVSADVTPDLAEDTTVPGEDVAEDLAEDSAGDAEVDPDAPPELPDIDWASLPTLPQDKTFTTRYVAGAGRRLINPEDSITMGGFGFCGGAASLCRWSEGIHDDISATATAIADTESGEVVIFIGLDSPGLLRPDVDHIHTLAQLRFYEQHGVYLDGPRLVISSSHAHSTPDATGIWGPATAEGSRDAAYIAMLRDEIVGAALDAFADLQDAQILRAETTAPNYDDDEAPDDTDVVSLHAETPTGDPIFTMTRWNAHPTGYGSGNNGISADYMGPFRKRAEEALGGLVAFHNGPIGSVYAEKLHPCGEDDPFADGYQDPDVAGEHERVYCVGFGLADAVVAAHPTGTPLGDQGVRFLHKTFDFHPTNILFGLLANTGALHIDPIDINDPESTMRSHFSWIRVGGLDYVTTPGESFPSFADRIEAELALAGAGKVVVLGVSQDWLGYLMTEEQYNLPELGYNRGLAPSEFFETDYFTALGELISEIAE
jgi:hypothetical protein